MWSIVIHITLWYTCVVIKMPVRPHGLTAGLGLECDQGLIADCMHIAVSCAHTQFCTLSADDADS